MTKAIFVAAALALAVPAAAAEPFKMNDQVREQVRAVRQVALAPDGKRVVFLRSTAGDDPVNRLWVLDTDTGAERMVADPATLLATDDSDLPAAERLRRERAREAASGITSYATDAAVTVAGVVAVGR